MQPLDDLLHVATTDTHKKPREDHPTGWRPGIEWNGSEGSLTTQPMAAEPDQGIWKHLIADWGLDPATVETVGPVQLRGWDTNLGEGQVQRMLYYKVNIQGRHDSDQRADSEALIDEIRKRKPRKPVTNVEDHALVVGLSDWQIGKGESDGSAGSVYRILTALEKLTDRIGEFKRLGRAPERIILVGLGDIVEGCDGHYAMQTHQVDLDRREQIRVAKRLILKYVDVLSGLTPALDIYAVPGNHGENRKDGKAFTKFTDNDDLAVFEHVSDILAANDERYGHVQIKLADALAATFETHGKIVGMAHMHQGRKGSSPQQRVETWWAGHALGRGHVQDADILMTGHYHHLMVSESTGRTWFQMPAMDPGSEWYEEATGQHSPPGMFTVSISEAHGNRGWDDIKVL